MKILFKRNILIFSLVLIVFFALRLPAFNQIYHQDEYRWATIANPVFDNFTGPHPPINKYSLRYFGMVFGYDNLRAIPLMFGFLNLIILFFVVRKITSDFKAALFAMFIYAINVYAIVANMQIDIDGAMLPFFGLVFYLAYINLLEKGRSRFWLIVLAFSIVGGFMAKLSFFLFVGAAILDYIVYIVKSDGFSLSNIIKRVYKIGLAMVAGGIFIFIAFSFWSDGVVIDYAKHFKIFNFGSRAYFEMFFKVMKSLVWLSPLLFIPVIGGLFNKDLFNKYRFWYIYIALNLFLYLVIFDFAKLTIERYMMFLVVPSVIISTDFIYRLIREFNIGRFVFISSFSAIFFAGIAMYLRSINQVVLPLNPKVEYLNRVKDFDFNFLIPLTGGSGPIGFYVSAFFVLVICLLMAVFLAGGLVNNKNKIYFVSLFLIFGLGYNFVLANEYLSGNLYGSVPNVARDAVDYVVNNPSIGKVITYYDIGAYKLRLADKYHSRFYTAPSRDYTAKISTYRGQYMIVDFPSIGQDARYWPFLEKCAVLKEFKDKKVRALILDCS